MDLLVLGMSLLAFRMVRAGLDRMVPLPPPVLDRRWKWVNTWTSFTHSLIVGSGALVGFYLYPQMAEDLIDTHVPGAHRLVGFSIGYFVEDFLDMVTNQTLHQCWELLFHHAVVIICLCMAFVSHRFVGFALVALLVEVNSIFLHLRSILRMAEMKYTMGYRIISLVNLITYVVFRITTLSWMTRWLVLNWEKIPLATYVVSTVGMIIIAPMNIILLYRVLCSDFLKSSLPEKER